MSVAAFERALHGAAVAMLHARLQRETAVARPNWLIDLPGKVRYTINAGHLLQTAGKLHDAFGSWEKCSPS